MNSTVINTILFTFRPFSALTTITISCHFSDTLRVVLVIHCVWSQWYTVCGHYWQLQLLKIVILCQTVKIRLHTAATFVVFNCFHGFSLLWCHNNAWLSITICEFLWTYIHSIRPRSIIIDWTFLFFAVSVIWKMVWKIGRLLNLLNGFVCTFIWGCALS